MTHASFCSTFLICLVISYFKNNEEPSHVNASKQILVVTCTNVNWQKMKNIPIRYNRETSSRDIDYENFAISKESDLTKSDITNSLALFKREIEKLKHKGLLDNGYNGFRIDTEKSNSLFIELRYIMIKDQNIENLLSLKITFDKNTHVDNVPYILKVEVLRNSQIMQYTQIQKRRIFTELRNFPEIPAEPSSQTK